MDGKQQAKAPNAIGVESKKTTPSDKKSAPSTLFWVFLAVIITGLVAANSYGYQKVKSKLNPRQAGWVYSQFIDDLKAGKIDAAYNFTGVDFGKIRKDPNSNLPPEAAKVDSPKERFKQLTASSSFQALKYPYVLYQDYRLKSNANTVNLVARFTDENGRIFDMYSQLSTNQKTWQINTLTLPDTPAQ